MLLRDGPDGPWSTFNLGVGQPLQSFRCLPTFSLAAAILPVKSPSCKSTTDAACAGRTNFIPDNSTTRISYGDFEAPLRSFVSLLPDDAPRVVNLGIDNVYFGNDAVRDLGFAEQYVGGWYSSNFFVGVFGLAVGPVRSTTGEGEKSNLLSALFTAGVVPSNTVGYTAGSIGSKYAIVMSYRQY